MWEGEKLVFAEVSAEVRSQKDNRKKGVKDFGGGLRLTVYWLFLGSVRILNLSRPLLRHHEVTVNAVGKVLGL